MLFSQIFFLLLTQTIKNNAMQVAVGIDVGTNSIGWAILINDEKGVCFIDQAGSRIIPMDATVLGNFDKGNSTSQTSERTRFRIIGACMNVAFCVGKDCIVY